MGSGSFWSLIEHRISAVLILNIIPPANFKSTRILTLLKEIFWILSGKFMSGSIIVTITKSWLFYVTSRLTYTFSWVLQEENHLPLTWLKLNPSCS